ncbi:MAG: DNA mismatch repair endonuclease MutL [Pyrinomonadaceae bacterium]
MNKIQILPDNLANQIAAGEVVERPASVIKELVENAIDAGSRRILIDIEHGGRRLIRISDDGDGMYRDDAILAFERHATSKIRTLADLAAINTLGFRGEALASIASVAKVELLTKTETDAVATRVIIEGGRLADVKDAARSTGTTITVRDLFFNTPARRKFMRSEATENYHLTNVIQHYGLALPEIAFTLTNNGREVLRVAPVKSIRERAFQIFGGSLLESLLPVNGGHEYIAKVSGFVSAPRERRTNRDTQYFFVNQRFVRDKTIARGLLEGFRSVLPHGVYPVAFLFLEISPEEIDVNVHPAKTEIRFRRGEAVKDVIAEAVRNALTAAGVTSDSDPSLVDHRASRSTGVDLRSERPAIPIAEGDAESRANEFVQTVDGGRPESAIATPPDVEQPSVFDDGSIFQANGDDSLLSLDFEREANDRIIPNQMEAASHHNEDEGHPNDRDVVTVLPPINSAIKAVRSEEPKQMGAARIRPIGQLHESFIIAVDDEGLLLIDQHVAHERILFDKFRLSETERSIESQNLLIPETIDLTPAQAEAFQLVENELGTLGFSVMRLSGRTVAIKSVPTDLPSSEARNLFAEILDTVEAEKRGAAKSTLRNDIAATLACKAAVKINMPLSQEKMQWMIDRLLLTTSPTTCPHGRPVILRLTMKDIERGFHRT